MKKLHQEYIINDKVIVKIYLLDGIYTSETFFINRERLLEYSNGFGFSCNRVDDDETLQSELKMWATNIPSFT